MTNEDRILAWKDTLRLSNKFFNNVSKSLIYNDIIIDKINISNIIWSEDTVSAILNNKDKRIAALNFADGYQPGGCIWQGVKTQEEDLCRSSNLYLFLSLVSYPIEGKCIYSKDVTFFRDSGLALSDIVKCDIISCPAVVRALDMKEMERRMRMILGAAEVNGVDTLVLGKWGCGAFGNDWGAVKYSWDRVIKEMWNG